MNILLSDYRPTCPDDFCGKTRLIGNLLLKKVAQIKANGGMAKWLFTGPHGVGKSSLAELIASELAGHSSQIEQLNGQSLSVDLVRSWERTLCYKPINGERWVRLVDEIDAASAAALGQLRTYLDRMRWNTVFIATTNKRLSELPQPLQTRFQPFFFEPVTPETFADWMESQFGFDRAIALDIGQRNLGCVRSGLIDCEAHLDRVGLS